MSKAIQVYDETEEKLVDIPEDEVESVQNTRLTYFAIQRNVFKSKPATISAREFITGLLQFGINDVENGLKQKPELDEQWKRISESVYDKLNDIATGVCDSEDDRAAIARFKKPYKQLSDAEKETLEEDLDDRYTLDAITHCLIAKALEIWTPKFWRLDEIAAKIEEAFQAEAGKQKAKAEKRVPVGN
jgi:hypothetical protein